MLLNQISLPNNHTDVDLKKVAYANFFYKNQEGLERRILPKGESVRGVVIPPTRMASYLGGFEMETQLERARRLDILDVWTPCLVLTLSNGHRLTYVGEKAITINKAWKARVYGGK